MYFIELELLMSDTVPASGLSIPSGLLLSRDLIFTSKVTGTARLLGRQVLTAGNSALARSMIEQHKPRAVFVDLAAGDLVRPEAIVAYRQVAGPDTAFVAFGSHVDTAGLAAAAEAGCDPVMPRSKFTAELPELIRRFLGADEPASS
jgi:DNA-binding NarL/FixJ family response regulator